MFAFSLLLFFFILLCCRRVSLFSFISRAFSLRFSSFLCAYTMVDLHPPYFRCLKIHYSPRLRHLVPFSLRTHSPLHQIRYLISVSLAASLFLSHFLSSSFPFRRLALPSPRSSSPSVFSCSNMATRCPITRLVLATVFPS